MTELLFREDAYMREATGTVVELTDQGGVVLDRALYYPTSGGQPGDSGELTWEGGSCKIATAVKAEGETVVLVPADGETLPEVGTEVTQTLDWDRRHRHMRVHTALHLLSVVIPLPVTGGQIGAEKGRLDFDMPDAPEDKELLEERLNDLISRDLTISEEWITDADLDANPGLVKTMSVQPPRGSGKIRLVRITDGDSQIDLQPCGGTHVKSTAEIGKMRFGKVEKKGARNRRVSIHLTE